jgi:hypothetical protein
MGREVEQLGEITVFSLQRSGFHLIALSVKLTQLTFSFHEEADGQLQGG